MNLPNMLEAKKRNKKEVNVYNYIDNDKKIGNNRKFYVRTYGCQMNEHDSEKIKGILKNNNFKEVLNIEEAEVIILNTCAIRENAHNKVFGFLGKVKHLKEKNPNIILGICGCMAQEENVVNEIMNKYKYVNFVFGTNNIDSLIELIDNTQNIKQNIEVYSNAYMDICEGMPHSRDSKITAYVDIILGCDKFCTYCIVPYTRGAQRSRSKESIINEVINLKNEGYKEVTLLGQNVNAYGKDLYENYNLADLLKDVSDTGIDRIRFVTSHPWDFTDEMIEVIKNRDNVMPYVHLPIQSGSNRILKLMGRRYTKESYLLLYKKLRTIENVSITTDIIVGFPDESEEDFEETINLVNECKFDGAFTFAYSPRENTPASIMKGQIDESVKMNRLNRLNEVVNKYSNINNNKYVGKQVKVLVLGKSEKGNDKVMGYTPQMKLVNVTANEDVIGKIIDVIITDAKSFSLDGKLIEKSKINS